MKHNITHDTEEIFYDREAGRETGPFVRVVLFELPDSVQCARRGVAETDGGTVYTLTVRRPEHADEISVRGRSLVNIATEWRAGTDFGNVARGLVEFERDYIPADMIADYRSVAASF